MYIEKQSDIKKKEIQRIIDNLVKIVNELADDYEALCKHTAQLYAAAQNVLPPIIKIYYLPLTEQIMFGLEGDITSIIDRLPSLGYVFEPYICRKYNYIINGFTKTFPALDFIKERDILMDILPTFRTRVYFKDEEHFPVFNAISKNNRQR